MQLLEQEECACDAGASTGEKEKLMWSRSKRRQWATNKWRMRVQKSDDGVEEEKKKVRPAIATHCNTRGSERQAGAALSEILSSWFEFVSPWVFFLGGGGGGGFFCPPISMVFFWEGGGGFCLPVSLCLFLKIKRFTLYIF
jgi:hypothetical protein